MFAEMGLRLKNLRLQNNLSRKQVSELAGVSVSVIGLYESGERLPSLSILMKLSAIYKASLDYIPTGSQPPSSPSMVSLEGLTERQTQIIKQTIACFRNPRL